jgi:hypothetical protein
MRIQTIMKTNKKTILITFCLIFLTLPLVALPTVIAHTPPWQIPTYAYISVSPNPIGVGQTALVVFWIDKSLPSSSIANAIRAHDFKLTITYPDGTTEVKNWPVVPDTTSSQYMSFTPSKIGEYTFKFDYLGQTYTWSGTYQNDVLLPSTKTTTLTVVQEGLPPIIGTYPLPDEYWTRPIEGQNTVWYKIASNWLGDKDFSGAGSPQIVNDFQPDGIAPNSSHVMWTRAVNDGGVVGGSNIGVDGNTFYTGSSYEQRFSKPIIVDGRLFYQLPSGNAAGGGGFQAVDLRTGEALWWLNTTNTGVPAFGYLYDYQTPNQHGVIPNGLLFTSNFAKAIDPVNGLPLALNITNVPSGYEVLGPSGEHLRYQVDTSQKWLAQWNSSKVFSTQTSGTINASLASRYDWNVSTPWLMQGATVVRAFRDDILLGMNGSLPVIDSGWKPYTMWAVSLKPESRGQLIWMKTYNAPDGNITLMQGPVDANARVFVFAYKETMQWVGYNLDTGEKTWGPTDPQAEYDYYQFSMIGGGIDYGKLAYGNMYSSAYGGICYCYDMKTGKLQWTYGNGDSGNNTSVGLAAPWPNWPMQVFAIADGKVYLLTGEHSANSPLYKGPEVRCIDAFTGKEIWTVMGYGGYRTRTGIAIADGFFVYYNLYDSQIYCFGKGPSAITVDAPNIAATEGSSIVIRGYVTDIAAGTKQKEQSARFPNGVPVVSDKSMSQWMEYVYMQKPRPTDATGVPVTISIVDANGNYREIGNATTSDGFFSLNWKPDIPGQYTVYASFGGSESYWPAHAMTSFAVDPAAATPTPTQVPLQGVADLYFIPAVAGLFVFIAIVAVVLILLQRKRP